MNKREASEVKVGDMVYLRPEAKKLLGDFGYMDVIEIITEGKGKLPIFRCMREGGKVEELTYKLLAVHKLEEEQEPV